MARTKNGKSRKRAPSQARNRKRNKSAPRRRGSKGGQGARVAGVRKQARKNSRTRSPVVGAAYRVALRLGSVGRCLARRFQAAGVWPRVRKVERLALLGMGLFFVVGLLLAATVGVEAQ